MADLQDLADRQAIRDLVYTYCRAVDRLDLPLGHSIWHDDGYADYGESYYQGPGKGVIDTICQHHLALLSHSHQVANILIDLQGDSAGSESYVTGTMRLMQEGRLMHMEVRGRYLDRWEKREGRWGLLHRVVVFDHDEIREVRSMGRESRATRDSSDPSYAVMRGRA